MASEQTSPRYNLRSSDNDAGQNPGHQGQEQNVNTDDPAGSNPVWDDRALYTPLFCLTEVPDSIMALIRTEATKTSTPIMLITSANPSRPAAIASIKSNYLHNRHPPPNPWLNTTPREAYNYHAKTLRSGLYDAPLNSGPFTYNTLLFIDPECIPSPSSPPSSLKLYVGTDTPEFGDGPDDITFMQGLMPYKTAFQKLPALQEMKVSMKEAMDETRMVASVMPPVTMVEVEGSRGEEWRTATAREARERRREIVRGMEGQDRQWDMTERVGEEEGGVDDLS